MAGSSDRNTFRDTFVFWVKVLILCFILGIVSFYIGRNYLGRFFSESELRDGAPEIVAQVEGADEPEASEVRDGPEEAEIVISERQGSDAEIARAQRELNVPEDAQTVRRSADMDGDADAADVDGDAPDVNAEADEQTTEETQSADESRFVVIAGSFLNAENSDRLLKELQDKGYQPYISRSVVNGKTYRRVNVGAFPSRSQATEMADKLRNDGYEVTVGAR